MIRPSRDYSRLNAFADQAIPTRQQELARLQAQINTGKRVLKPSDDPSAFSVARQQERMGLRITQYQNTIASARPWMDHTQQSLDSIAEAFASALERGVQGANGSLDATAREAVANRIEALSADVFDRLNAKLGDEYLFGGTRTDAPPFVRDGNTVTYAGNDGHRTRTIADGIRIDLNVTGADLFSVGGSSLTDRLQALADAVRSGDADQVQAALGGVEQARDHVLEKAADVGTIANRLSAAEGYLQEAYLHAETRRSRLEDTDMAEALMQMQQAQIGLEAALKVTASVKQITILDYLR